MMVDRLCVGLIDGMEARKAQLAREAAMFDLLTTNPSEDPPASIAAITALHMYRAVEEIQALEGAFVRLQEPHRGKGRFEGVSAPRAMTSPRRSTRGDPSPLDPHLLAESQARHPSTIGQRASADGPTTR